MSVVTPPVSANTLLAIVGAATPVGYDVFGGFMRLDAANDVTYQFELGTPATGAAGIKKFTNGSTGTETLQATETTIFGAGPAHTLNPNDPCYHPSGVLVTMVDSNSNSAPLAVINATTLVSQYVAGISSASLSPSVTGRYLQSFQLVPLQAGDSNYVVSRGLTGASHENEVGVFRIDNATLTVVYAQNITEEVARLCTGDSSDTNSVSSFYVIGDLFNRGSGNTTGVVFYEYLVHATTVGARTIRTINPVDIDATWTKFDLVSNPGYDTSDGNVLVFFSTQEAVTNQYYLAKFRVSDGTILWKTPVPAQAPSSVDLPNCSINGTLGIFSSSTFALTLVNLTTGASTTQAWNHGFSAISGQMWDYRSGSLSGNLSYSQSGTGPVPTYTGGYLAGNANTIPSFRWGRLFTAQTYVVPDVPPPPGADAPQTAWTYFLDGHQFYVIDLGDQGTFLYDQLTNQWCKFITTSTDPLWNMAVGTVWNSRVVGGDRTLNKVWELDPNAVLDNGTDEITRVVTGMIQRRSRNYMGVGAVRVVCSSGALDGSGNGTITLRFSDDLEHTWSDNFDITLINGDYSQEIAWRALGSFAAPGRVFEVSDSGGLVRIDSADIDPEKDADEAPGS